MINTVILTGRLAKDPELKVTQSGVSLANFTVAIERSYRSGEDKITDFFDCVAWRKSAEFIAQYFHKGDMIGVEGSLRTNKWQDNEGNNRTKINVEVAQAHFCGSKNANSGNYSKTNNSDMNELSEGEIVGEEDLPF